MKTILIIQDGIQQIVLTPENDYEKNILLLINNNNVETTLKVGNFAECDGGWIRNYPYHSNMMYCDGNNKIDSLMIVLRDKSKDNKTTVSS